MHNVITEANPRLLFFIFSLLLTGSFIRRLCDISCRSFLRFHPCIFSICLSSCGGGDSSTRCGGTLRKHRRPDGRTRTTADSGAPPRHDPNSSRRAASFRPCDGSGCSCSPSPAPSRGSTRIQFVKLRASCLAMGAYVHVPLLPRPAVAVGAETRLVAAIAVLGVVRRLYGMDGDKVGPMRLRHVLAPPRAAFLQIGLDPAPA